MQSPREYEARWQCREGSIHSKMNDRWVARIATTRVDRVGSVPRVSPGFGNKESSITFEAFLAID